MLHVWFCRGKRACTAVTPLNLRQTCIESASRLRQNWCKDRSETYRSLQIILQMYFVIPVILVIMSNISTGSWDRWDRSRVQCNQRPKCALKCLLPKLVICREIHSNSCKDHKKTVFSCINIAVNLFRPCVYAELGWDRHRSQTACKSSVRKQIRLRMTLRMWKQSTKKSILFFLQVTWSAICHTDTWTCNNVCILQPLHSSVCYSMQRCSYFITNVLVRRSQKC